MEDFDNEAGKTYVYPINYPMRDYQFDIVKAALFKNTLVCLPTGLGKTFIGAVLIYNFYRWYPTGKVVFMAPTKPLVAQQIEACHKVMGIPQEHTAEITGLKSPQLRSTLWKTQRVFFLTPQVLMNDLSRDACPQKVIKLLVVDEAHRALGQHSYCQVIKLLQQQNCTFRVLALSATPGTDFKAVTQVIENLCIAHIELRNEDSPDIVKYVHKRNIEKIIIPIEGELKSIIEKFYEILRPHVLKLIDNRLVYTKDEKSFTQYQVLLAREAFRKNPPSNISQREKGIYEGLFAVCATLYHANELLIMHGIKSFYNFLKESESKSSNYMLKAEFKKNSNLHKLLEYINEKFYSPISKSNCEMENLNLMSSEIIPTSHPKMDKLREILLKHFKDFTKNNESTRVMIFSQYRDSVQEIAKMLENVDPLIRPISFIGQSSGQFKGLSQKEQIKVVKGFREGNYNTLISTCVGEEGLDIGEVDLIICYDAPKSAIRLVQRMGRTGRKREGEIIVLVTTGKEEKDYNQSQYKRRSLVNMLMKGEKMKQHLYYNNPRMIPKDINPVCLKLHMKVVAWEAPNYKQQILKKGKRSISAFFHNSDHNKYKKDENFMNALELKKYEANFKLDDVSLIKKIPKPRFHGAANDYTDVNFCKEEICFSTYQPWYTTLQPCFLVSHSKQTKHLVELTDFISMQEALGNNNSYEDELAPFMEYSFFKKVTDKKLETYTLKNSVKKNALIKEKKLSKKGIASFLTVKDSHKLALAKSKFSETYDTNEQDLKNIHNGEINLNSRDNYDDTNMNDSVLLLQKSEDCFKLNSLNLEVYRNDKKLHLMDNVFDFLPTNKKDFQSKVINCPAVFQITGTLFPSLTLTPYIKQINDISDRLLLEEQKLMNMKFSIFESSFPAKNLMKDPYEEPVSSIVDTNFMGNNVEPYVSVSSNQELLLLEKRSVHYFKSLENKRNFSSMNFDNFVNLKKESAHLTTNKNFDLETSSILLTPPESKKESPFNSNCTFNFESPIFSAKQKLPIKCPSLYTSTPRQVSKDGNIDSPIQLGNVTPIVAHGNGLSDSNRIAIKKANSTSKAAKKNCHVIVNSENFAQNRDDIDFCLSSDDDDLFSEIDLKTLIKNKVEENTSCFDHKLLKCRDVTFLKSTSELSTEAKDWRNSFKTKLSKFHRDQDNKDISLNNPNSLLSVTQVIDMVNRSSVHNASFSNVQCIKNLNSQLPINALDKIKPKIVKNLSGQFEKSFPCLVTTELSDTLSEKPVKPRAKSKSPNGKGKLCEADKMSCCKTGIVDSACGVNTLFGKKDHIVICNETKETASIQFNISLDLSSDSDENTEHSKQENNDVKFTSPNFNKSCSSKTSNYENRNMEGIEKKLLVHSNSQILNRDQLNATNSTNLTSAMIFSKGDKFSSDDELFDNLDVLALESNVNNHEAQQELSNKLSKNELSTCPRIPLVHLENKTGIDSSKLNLPANDNESSTGEFVNILGEVKSTKNHDDILPLGTLGSVNKNLAEDSKGSIRKKTGFTEMDSPLVIKKKKKVNVLDSSTENSLLLNNTSKSLIKSSDSSSSNLISTTSSNDDFVDDYPQRQKLKRAEEKRRRIGKCSKRKMKLSNCGLLHLEAEESGDSVEASSDENESHLDRYEQSFVDDETQAMEQNVDMRAVYLQSVKSPLKKKTKYTGKEAWSVQDILSQPQSDDESEQEDSFVVANDFVEYDSEHLGYSDHLEDSILSQVLLASMETAKEECKKRESKKRKRIMMNISSEEEDLHPAKIKFGKDHQASYSKDKSIYKTSDDKAKGSIDSKNKKEVKGSLDVANTTMKKTAIQEANKDGLDFQLLSSDDEEDWLKIPLKNDGKINSNKSAVHLVSYPKNHAETNIKNSCQSTGKLSPKFASKHLSQNISNCRTSLPQNQDDIISLKSVASSNTLISSSNFSRLNKNIISKTKCNNVIPNIPSPKEDSVISRLFSKFDHSETEQKNLKQCLTSTAFSSTFNDVITNQSQVLNSQCFVEAEVCILVDTCEIGIAGLLSSLLRSSYNLQTYVVQAMPASYVLSSRMAIYRLSNTAFASIANKAKLITRIRNLLSIYSRPVLIVEKDRKSGTKLIARTSYLDSISCAFAQLPQLKVIYTEDQNSTAETIWHLTKLEKLKGHCIPKFSPGGFHFEQAIKFYRTVPQVSCSCAIFLALNYPTIREAVNSDLKELMKNGKMSAEVATAFRSHFTRTFRKDMLPMSYQLESS